jgi:hypothetical protein
VSMEQRRMQHGEEGHVRAWRPRQRIDVIAVELPRIPVAELLQIPVDAELPRISRGPAAAAAELSRRSSRGGAPTRSWCSRGSRRAPQSGLGDVKALGRCAVLPTDDSARAPPPIHEQQPAHGEEQGPRIDGLGGAAEAAAMLSCGGGGVCSSSGSWSSGGGRTTQAVLPQPLLSPHPSQLADNQAAELNAARAARGGRGLTSRWRRGGGDGAGPHVGAVVLPAEQRRGRTMGWSVALTRF